MEHAESDYFEEVMLQGMVLGYVKADLEEILHYIKDFIPKIDNWSVCDSFCTGLKFTLKNKEQMWDFIVPHLLSEKEYEIRFAVVMMLNFFIEEAYINRILQLLDKVRHEGYYVKMAVSWALSMCYVKMPAATIDYLRTNTLDDFTYNKALQKITESYRVDPETKKMIRGMKRKKTSPLCSSVAEKYGTCYYILFFVSIDFPAADSFNFIVNSTTKVGIDGRSNACA